LRDATVQVVREFGAWLSRFDDLIVPGHVVIDLGCGLGDDTAQLAAAGMLAFGFDRDKERVVAAARKVPSASFAVCDLADGICVRDGVVDLVIASLSLHYFDLTTSRTIVGDVARVLRPGGRLLARVNAVGDVDAGYGQGVELEPDFFEVAPGRCKRFFSEASLRALLDDALRVEEVARETTRVHGTYVKQTIVARARRPLETT
jgi:SAM-dependent methyltransferase